ncbi:MAG TPA: PLP-dependent transferase, partial [Gemmatimonadaceae bacterium]|nr:PLP-dependent transferase [Gemmatimonadaceae bacterium]
ARPLRQVRIATGAIMHPLAAYLLHRGLPTLSLRVLAAQARAGELARRLARHPMVQRVGYPGLPGGDPQSLLGRQMAGAGSLLAFDVVGGLEAAACVMKRVRLIVPAVSLGSTDTLIQHPAGLTHRLVPARDREALGIDDGMLRLSVGIEAVDDIWADLEEALDAAAQTPWRAAGVHAAGAPEATGELATTGAG